MLDGVPEAQQSFTKKRRRKFRLEPRGRRRHRSEIALEKERRATSRARPSSKPEGQVRGSGSGKGARGAEADTGTRRQELIDAGDIDKVVEQRMERAKQTLTRRPKPSTSRSIHHQRENRSPRPPVGTLDRRRTARGIRQGGVKPQAIGDAVLWASRSTASRTATRPMTGDNHYLRQGSQQPIRWRNAGVTRQRQTPLVQESAGSGAARRRRAIPPIRSRNVAR